MPKALLIVEDDPIQREGLATVLRQNGFAVALATDGVQALERMRQGPPPDLILLDMMMPPPAHDGWYFVEQRKRVAALASIPVVIITGLTVASREWAASLGAAGVVKKPIDVDMLLVEIQRCCGLSPAPPAPSSSPGGA